MKRSWWLLLLALSACGRSSLIGGEECPPGTVPNSAGQCDPVGDGGPPVGDGGLSDGPKDATPDISLVCSPPLVLIDGKCVPCPPGTFYLDGKCTSFIFEDWLFDFATDAGSDAFDGGQDGSQDDLGDALLPPPDLSKPDMVIPCNLKKEICNNFVDDNCNFLIDCKDPQCAGDQSCVKKGQEICNNGLDDDNNDLIDCLDPVCFNFPGCKPHVCDPNNVDCSDPACADQLKCKDLVCKPTVDLGSLNPHDSSSKKTVSTIGTVDVSITPCAPGGGGMVVTKFNVASDSTAVRMDFIQSLNSDHVFGLFRSGVNQKCGANPVNCYDPKSAASGHTTWSLNKGDYYLIVQAFTKNHQGTVDVTLSTSPSIKPEVCDNGIDDDGNGLIDCADPGCTNAQNCKMQQCNPDYKIGTLVVGDAAKSLSFDAINGKTTGVSVQCAGAKGKATAVQFSLSEPAGVLMTFSETGDHSIGLYRLPPAGNACDAKPLDCMLPPGPNYSNQIDWSELSPGTYLFIFQANKIGDEGHIDVTLKAHINRKVELCHNGIDDDGNGLIDCADPSCYADPGCGPPPCTPDVDFGTLHIGDQKSTVLDLKTGVLNETLSCAKGGGKAKIVQITLAENAGMGFFCSQPFGTDAVLGLFAQAGPRDGCDKQEVACGDPKVIPFGCNYEIPNLQPGTYYVIAEAFQAGKEGTLNLTLSSIFDRALEICNNKIDDDVDGFIDCADKKCATSPYCIQKQCKADDTIDPMPVGGTKVDKLLTTVGKQVTAQPSCEAAPGGGNAVIFLNMPKKANLTVGFLQFGNHVFAIYPYLGAGLICEAASAIGCQASNGSGSGTVTFNDVPAGKYWFIVAASKPGTESSIALEFTAL